MTAVHHTWLPVLTDPVRLTLLRLLHQYEITSVRELAEMAHTSNRTLRRHLEALIALGFVREVEADWESISAGRPASRFLLSPRVRRGLDDLFAVLSHPLEP